MRMRTSHKLKMQENIASMSLTILVGDITHTCNEISPLQLRQIDVYRCVFRINANLVKEGSFRINAKLVKEELKYQLTCTHHFH